MSKQAYMCHQVEMKSNPTNQTTHDTRVAIGSIFVITFEHLPLGEKNLYEPLTILITCYELLTKQAKNVLMEIYKA